VRDRFRSKLVTFLAASIFSFVLAVAVLYFYESLKMRQQIAGEVVGEAAKSRLIERQVGTPITMAYFVSGRVIGGMDGGTADLEIPISGPNGSGKLLDWSQGGFGGWRVCSLTFRPSSGPDVVIAPDETSTCERE
jgi:hypothetical protein